jgi:hypothetical protein
MGCSDADDLDKKITKKADHDIFELIQFNHESRQSMYEKLERKLSKFCDSKKELNHIVNGIIDFVEKLEDFDIEYLSAMDMDYNLICDHYTLHEQNKVVLCPKGKETGKTSALLFVIHNHPSNIPLQSYKDIMSFAIFNVKYNIVYTQNRELFIIKNSGADTYDIKMGWNDTIQEMRKHYMKNDSDSYNYEYSKYLCGFITPKELVKTIGRSVIEYMGQNINETVPTFKECMGKHNVDTIYLSYINFK